MARELQCFSFNSLTIKFPANVGQQGKTLALVSGRRTCDARHELCEEIRSISDELTRPANAFGMSVECLSRFSHCQRGISTGQLNISHRVAFERTSLWTTNHRTVPVQSRRQFSVRVAAAATEVDLTSPATLITGGTDVSSSSESVFSVGSSTSSPVSNSAELSAIDSSSLPSADGASMGQTADFSSGFSPESAPGYTSPDDLPGVLSGVQSTDSSPTESALDVLQSSSVDGSESALDVLKSSGVDGSGPQIFPSYQERVLKVVEESKQVVLDSIKAWQETQVNSLAKLESGIKESIDAVRSAVKNTYGDVNGSLVSAFKSVTGTYDQTVNKLQSQVDHTLKENMIDFTSPFQMGTPANNAIKDVVVFVKTVGGSALVTSASAISQVYGSSKGILPPDVRSALSNLEALVLQITEPVGSVLNQAYVVITDVERSVGVDPENPAIPVVIVVLGTVFLGFILFQSRYGGYSGDLLPSEALDALKKEGNVVLVDIRPQEEIDTDGIPDLRRGARSKFASVEIVKVDEVQRRKLKFNNDIETILTAAVISNLKNVNRSTKVIVLDTDGSKSKQIARGLGKFGFKLKYCVEGGYKAWSSSGLRCKPEGSANVLSILKEDTEAIVEEVKPTPFGVIAVGLGAVAGLYALIEWEKTLQLIGVIGIGQAIYRRLNTYESIEDAKADLSLFQKPFKSATQAILWIAGQVEPEKLLLATAPASSAVQGRVIQAAAKHGPLASELGTTSVEEEAVHDFDDADSSTSHVSHTSLPNIAEEPLL